MIPNNRQAKIKQSGTQYWNITVILPFTNNFTIKHSKRNFAFLLSWCQVSEIVSVIMNLTYLHCYISQIICYSKLSIIFFFNLQMKNISSTWTNRHIWGQMYFLLVVEIFHGFFIFNKIGISTSVCKKSCNFIWWFNSL